MTDNFNLDAVLASVERAASEQVLDEIRDVVVVTPLAPIERERIVQAYRARYDAVVGIKLPLDAVRKELRGPVDADPAVPAATTWVNGWVWVASHDKYFDMSSSSFASITTFNMLNGIHIPRGLLGSKPPAHSYCMDDGLVPVVTAPAYLPDVDERLVNLDGRAVVNTFNADSLPAEAPLTDAGRQYCGMIERHVAMVCGSDEAAALLMQWLAHQVQKPGKKILWAPLIQSIEGVGKSFFGELLRACLGVENVGVVKPDQIASQFNAWAVGACVNVLEELKIAGHNRHEALNAMKPLITDDQIQVHPKKVSPFTTRNCTNYIAFTNAVDALPVAHTDRRWWIVQSPIRSLEDVSAATGVDKDDYFPALFDGLVRHRAEVVGWMLDYEIGPEFYRIRQAPMTAAKSIMTATEEAGVEGLEEAREVIERGAMFVSEGCLSSAYLWKEVSIRFPGFRLDTRAKAQVLKRLGYQRTPARIKIGGEPHQVWTSRPMLNSAIRDILVENGNTVGEIVDVKAYNVPEKVDQDQ